jgi:hypothetical protein
MNYLDKLIKDSNNRKSYEADNIKMKELITKIQAGRTKHSTKFLSDLEHYLEVYDSKHSKLDYDVHV